MFIVNLQSCQECDEHDVILTVNYPTMDQIAEAMKSLGNMWCLHYQIYQVEPDSMGHQVE